jgi:hypothetical protein
MREICEWHDLSARNLCHARTSPKRNYSMTESFYISLLYYTFSMIGIKILLKLSDNLIQYREILVHVMTYPFLFLTLITYSFYSVLPDGFITLPSRKADLVDHKVLPFMFSNPAVRLQRFYEISRMLRYTMSTRLCPCDFHLHKTSAQPTYGSALDTLMSLSLRQ